ncbi:MAG: NAD(P)/FAD-dependent oxidoreductase [Actinobacteria bacterium]|nr:NAD(P)/FAD-dependent oxidoreductase [Actinomycetota bacterium]MBU1942759.1 NAD(P)/FAD-dependent oxidoreductase [Actinomycetota bacterium]MBU2686081.1 NAD(P)/FAD-dependent oxidoreductase [Actinomycetota bacterium]
MKRVVVIGSGPGGSSCAALLQSRGLEVTLLEQNEFLGGKCSTREENGFKVDTGIHMFATGVSGPHGQVARELGVPQPWLSRDPSESMWLNEKGIWYLYQKLHSPAAIREVVMANITGRQEFDALNTLKRSVSNFGLRGLMHELHGIRKALPWFIEKYDRVTTSEFLHLFTDDVIIHRAMNCLSMLLLVVPSTRSSAGEFISVFSEIFRYGTLGVPRGGAIGVPRSFMRAFRRDGGNLVMGVAATKILVDGGRVTGVLGSDGVEYPAEVVISNAGLKQTVDMAGPENFPGEYVDYVKGLELSYSWMASKLFIKGRGLDLKAPSFFPIPQVEPERIFEYCDEPGGLPADPFLFCPIPTDWDPTLAPPGHQLILVGVPTSNEVDQEERSQKMLDIAEEKFFGFFPDVRDKVVARSRITNKDTNRITRKGTGECIGLAQIPGQTGVDKPHPKMPVEGLWAVGCDAGARGVGTEQGTASGMLVASLVS